MSKTLLATLGVAVTALVPLGAQTNSQCASQTLDRSRNVCDAAIDGARLFHPVVGLLVSGGNPVIGEAGSQGGFPHFSVGLRVNAAKVITPDLNYNGVGRTVAADAEVTAPAPIIEGALGLFRGISGGNFAIDALGSAQLLPTDQIDDVRVSDDATRLGSIALAFGYGARVTVLGGRGALPAVSASVMRRSLPRIDVGDVPGGDRFAFGSDLVTTAYRVTVGKGFGPIAVAVGVGRDSYGGTAEVSYRDPITNVVQPNIRIDLDDARNLGFVNAAILLGGMRIAAEVGTQQGRDLRLGTTFEQNDPRDGRLFGGAGIRVAF